MVDRVPSPNAQCDEFQRVRHGYLSQSSHRNHYSAEWFVASDAVRSKALLARVCVG